MRRVSGFLIFSLAVLLSGVCHAYTNDEIAGVALSYDREENLGQCKEFVYDLMNDDLEDIELGTGYCQCYLDAGSEVSGGLSNAIRGDVIQINTAPTENYCTSSHNTTFTAGMHTAIFLEDLGDGVIRVLDSNFYGGEDVFAHDWDVEDHMDTYSSLYLHVYRLGTTTQEDFIYNYYRELLGAYEYSIWGCEGVTGGSGTNWVYSCTTESYTYDQNETIYVLAGIHNIREDHYFAVSFYRGSTYLSTSYSSWNYVEPDVWEHAYTWPTFSTGTTGSYYAYAYVYTDGWSYLDYIPFTVE